MNQNIYYKNVDVLKVFLLFLVILGHCLLGSLESNPVRYLIYSFHMPLFLAVSGFLIKKESITNISFLNLTVKYARRMLCAWFMAVIVYWVIISGHISIHDLFQRVAYPYFHLWYVSALFGMIIMLFIFEKLAWKIRLQIFFISFIFGLSWCALYSDDPARGGPQFLKLMGDKRTYYYFCFFYLGYLLRNEKVNFYINNFYIKVLIVFFAVLRLADFFYIFPPLVTQAIFFVLNFFLINTFLFMRFSYFEDRLNSFFNENTLFFYLWHLLIPAVLMKYNVHKEHPFAYQIIFVFWVLLIIPLCKLIQGRRSKWIKQLVGISLKT